MPKMPGLTREQHEALGPELRDMRNRLMTLTVRVSNAIGANKPATKELTKAYQAIDAARHALDNLLRDDHLNEMDEYTYF